MLKRKLTRDDITRYVGEQNIFNKYFGPWEYGTCYSSVFRKDEHKSTGFYLTENGTIIYNDLRTNDKYDCVRFVMKRFGCNYYQAIAKIAADFGLNADSIVNAPPKAISPLNAAAKPLKKVFIVHSSKFKKEHINYWQQYGITTEELKANQIFAVESYVINQFDENGMRVKEFHSPRDNEIKFAYTFSRNGEKFFKIYTPYSKEFKWVGNVPLDLPFGLDTLPYKSDTLIITKSVKNCLVLRKFFPDVIGLQNESSSSIADEALQELISKYKNIYTWFDYDRAGLKACNYYRKVYGFKPLWTVCNNKSMWQNLSMVKERKIKDPSDFVAKYTMPVFEQYLQYIKMI